MERDQQIRPGGFVPRQGTADSANSPASKDATASELTGLANWPECLNDWSQARQRGDARPNSLEVPCLEDRCGSATSWPHDLPVEQPSKQGWTVRRVALAGAIVQVVAMAGLAVFPWHGNMTAHSLIEIVSTCVMTFAGILAALRYFARREAPFLFLTIGLLGAGVLDGFHTVATSPPFASGSPSELSSLAAWSWLASRIFLAVLCCLSWQAWHDVGPRATSLAQRPSPAVIAATFTVLSCAAFFVIVPVHNGYWQLGILGRPLELVPAGIFLVTLLGYLRRGPWHAESIFPWLVLSLVGAVLCQGALSPFSQRLFDPAYMAAHVLKLGSYVSLLAGMCAAVFSAFRDADRQARESFEANRKLEAQGRDRSAAMAELVAKRGELARHVDELERFNRLAVNRELRIAELKKEVNFWAEQGSAPVLPYDVDFAVAAPSFDEIDDDLDEPYTFMEPLRQSHRI